MPADPRPFELALAGRFLIRREIGRGGSATVFLADDIRNSRPVALKVLHPELAATVTADRFSNEIEVVGRLQHPHILPIYESGHADGLLYCTMPFVSGESLRTRLERDKRLPVSDTIRIVTEVADALTYAHEKGIVHRDIKPGNILLSGSHAVVTDFGIARAIEQNGQTRLTRTGTVVGTPAYMSPEQGLGDTVIDSRADIYSLGCVAFEMLAGSPPFGGNSPLAVIARHAVDPIPRLRTVRADVPPAVERAVARSLAKRPQDRFETARNFGAALASDLGDDPRQTAMGRAAGFLSKAGFAGLALFSVALGSTSWLFGQARGGALTGERSFALFPYVSAWLTTVLGVWFLFSRAEETLSPETRLSVARWLRNLDPFGQIETWPEAFVRGFDRLFGENHLSIRCLLRSIIASFVALAVLFLIWAAMRPESLVSFATTSGLEGVGMFLTFTLLLNLFADYLSLLETRTVLGVMARAKSPDSYSFWLVLDFFLTLIIWLVFFTGLPLVVLAPFSSAASDALLYVRNEVLDYGLTLGDVLTLDSNPGKPPVGLWFYSTFFTSVWLWLYALGGVLVRTAPRLGLALDRIRRILDFEHEPLHSLGMVAVLLTTVAFAVGLILAA